MNDMAYVQIGGNVKTGTSLLSALLDGHPEVVGYPGETGMTGYLFPIISDPLLSLACKVERICRIRFRGHTQPPAPGITWEELERAFCLFCADIANDPFELHRALLCAFYQLADPDALLRARFWVDKSPFAHLFAEEIFGAYPAAKFLQMIRDPKDNYASIASKHQRKRVKTRRKMELSLYRYRVWSAQAFWYAQRNSREFGPDRYMVIRFEDLCQRPREVVPRICEFLGIEETPALYMPTRAGLPYGGNNFEGKSFDGIYAGNVGNWRSRMPEYYGRVMECQRLDLLTGFGYPTDFRPGQRARAARASALDPACAPRQASGDQVLARADL
ncbi:sulfotransferase [Candidatus Bipolaricaulota bacterium]|nr:sulfotransferase [Candidatus Bipolaricaulota bacterium]